jgi:uncharacterized surface protein with fasciclin (FAS1) repeats
VAPVTPGAGAFIPPGATQQIPPQIPPGQATPAPATTTTPAPFPPAPFPPAPAFPPNPTSPSPSPSPPSPPSPVRLGTPGPAPQLSIPPPAPQIIEPTRDPDAPPATRRKIPGLPSIAELVVGKKVNSEVGFFADALVATGLLQLFDSPGPFTVFVPTNRAWYDALVSLGVTKEDIYEDPALTEVMMYHVARRELYTHGMFFGQKIPTMHTAAPNIARAARAAIEQGVDPAQVYLALTEGLEIEVFQTILQKAYFVNGCDVRRSNVQASNGVVHVIDCVLFPPSPQPLPTKRTVASVIVDRFELSIFEQALTGGGLLNAINRASAENPLTVFAPTNTAFIKYIATNPGFFIDTAAERVVNPGVPGLQETLLYHFIPARLQSGLLETHNTQTLRTFEGKDVYVESFRGGGGFGAGASHASGFGANAARAKLGSKLFVNGCRLRAVDFVCVDGVVHTIDCVLQPNFRDDKDKFFGDTS